MMDRFSGLELYSSPVCTHSWTDRVRDRFSCLELYLAPLVHTLGPTGCGTVFLVLSCTLVSPVRAPGLARVKNRSSCLEPYSSPTFANCWTDRVREGPFFWS